MNDLIPSMLGINSNQFAIVFGRVLRDERKRAKLTQEELGFEANLQRNYISLMELGRYQPTIETIFKIAFALKIPPSSLVAKIEGGLTVIDKKLL